jgi:ABC transport system ATP-binding/permease protein
LDTQVSIVTGLPPRSQAIEVSPFVLGRAVEVDFVLSHPEISRRHCRVVREGEQWFLEDLGSQRGTLLNGSRISGRAELKNGDQITLGPIVVAFGAISDDGKESTTESGAAPGSVLYRKQPADVLPLTAPLVFGRSDEADVQLSDPSVSRRHAQLEQEAAGFRLVDLHSKSGSFVNGRRFDAHDLVIGDQIQIGPFYFVFDGRQLYRVRRLSLGRIVARGLSKRGGAGIILNEVNFVAEPGQFVGILGPSGAGKTTLLNALSGLRPADEGNVLFDQIEYRRNDDQLRALFGYVPQDDIVHLELTVDLALRFAAKLRLPAATPVLEIEKLISHTLANLGLAERRQLPIARLSGGQRKRVSVAVELLNRPPLLFLDEPTSGLDPAAEFKLMELLRRLADTGCTVICTTHVMENVYLMDQIGVIVDGRLVFLGPPDAARNHFGVQRLTGLYDALQAMDVKALPSYHPPEQEQKEKPPEPAPLRKVRRPFALPILLQRQAAIFRSDLKNLIIVFAQPVIIGALVAWVTDEPALIQFFAYLGTLWFGCSNSAQEIVRELPIYRRERLVGLDRFSYLTSKFLWIGCLTLAQSLLLYFCMGIGELGLKGAVWWQLLGLVLLSFVGTGIGLAVSSMARSAIQAVMLIPLLLIPQILFSGLTVPANEMSPPVLWVSHLMPSFSSQRITDMSFLLNQRITGEVRNNFPKAYDNLNAWYRSITGERLRTSDVLTNARPLWVAYATLAAWIGGTFALSYFLLARKERE